MEELSLYSVEDLVRELVGRSTFYGLVIRKKSDFRNDLPPCSEFVIAISPTMQRHEAANLIVIFHRKLTGT